MTRSSWTHRGAVGSLLGAGTLSLSGCFGSSNHKDLLVTNDDDRSHEVTVSVTTDGAPDGNASPSLAPDESRQFDDWLYLTDASYVTDLRVGVDSEPVRRVRLRVNPDYDRLRVTVMSATVVDIQPDSEIESRSRTAQGTEPETRRLSRSRDLLVP